MTPDADELRNVRDQWPIAVIASAVCVPATHVWVVVLACFCSGWVGGSHGVPVLVWALAFVPALLTAVYGLYAAVVGKRTGFVWQVVAGVFCVLASAVAAVYALFIVKMMEIG
jgi:hypothetical protein